jgi:hypothetical protein
VQHAQTDEELGRLTTRGSAGAGMGSSSSSFILGQARCWWQLRQQQGMQLQMQQLQQRPSELPLHHSMQRLLYNFKRQSSCNCRCHEL